MANGIDLMAWTHFSTFAQPGDPVTVDMIRELVDAFDERLKAACDTGAGVDYGEYQRPLLSLNHIPYDMRNLWDQARPYKEHLALAIIRLSAARVHSGFPSAAELDHYGYIYYDASADEWKLYQYINNDGNVLRQAATDLGYDPDSLLEWWTPSTDDDSSSGYVGTWNDRGGLRTAFIFNVLRRAIQMLEHPIIPRLSARDTNNFAVNISGFNQAFDKNAGADAPWSDAVDAFHQENFGPVGFGSPDVAEIQSSYSENNDSYSISGRWGRGFFILDPVFTNGFRPLAPFVQMFALSGSEVFASHIYSSANGGATTTPAITPGTDGARFSFWFSDQTVTDTTAANGAAAYVDPQFTEFDSGIWEDPAFAANGTNNSYVRFTEPKDLIAGRWPWGTWAGPVPLAFVSAAVSFSYGPDS